MQCTLDPDHLRSQMRLRRAATDIKLPMHTRLKVHFMTHRAELLSNFSLTAGAWMLLLQGCNTRDVAQLDALKADIIEFKAWADEELQALQRMGLQECVAGGDIHMPDDPQLVAAMRRMLGFPDPSAPGGSA